MGGLFGGGDNNATTTPVIASVQFQTSAYGGTVPVVVGSRRIAANVIWYNDFLAIPHTSTQKTGKGGGGSGQTNTSYTYTANVILGICEGPGTILQCFQDKDIFSPGDPQWGFSIFTGTEGQTPWSIVTSLHPTEALGYGGLVYAAALAIDLGTQATMKNNNFLVACGPAGGITTLYPVYRLPPYSATEYNPMDVLPYITAASELGMGWPSNSIDPATLADAKNYCAQAGLIGAWAWLQAAPGIQQLLDLFTFANCAPVMSGGVLKVIPYADQPVGSWSPNTAPIYALTIDNFLTEGDEPVRVTVRDLADTYNRLTAQFSSAALGYVDDTVTVEDLGDQNMYGLRQGSNLTINGAIRVEVARQVAQLALQKNLLVRCQYEFKLPWNFALLEGMDLVTLYAPNLAPAGVTVRLKEVTENEDGSFNMIAEDWPTGVASAVLYGTDGGTGTGSVRNALPGPADPPFLFEPPGDLTGWKAQVWIGAYGQSLDWGGCNIWASRDNASYSQVGRIMSPARLGSIASASMAYSSNGLDPTLDTSSVCVVDLKLSRGDLIPVSTIDCDRYETLSVFGDSRQPSTFELVSYRDAALIFTHGFNLTSRFRRGLFGTALQAGNHPAGSYFMRLDNAVAQIDTSRWNIGDTLYIKLQSFNTYQTMAQDLSTLSPVTYTILGNANMGVAPSNVTLIISSTVPP